MNIHTATPRRAEVNPPADPTLELAGAAATPLRASLRMPVTPSNRADLRSLRAAESARWDLQPKPDREKLVRAARATLRTQVAQLAREKRHEALVYGTLAGLSAATVVAVLWDSFRLFESWPTFVQFVQSLLA